MSGPEDAPVVAAIAPLEALRKREIRAAAERARDQDVEFKMLPVFVAMALAMLLLSSMPDLWAIVWSPPPASTWETVDGIIEGGVVDGENYYSMAKPQGEILLACAPLLKSAKVCSVRYEDELISRIGRPTRVRLYRDENWLGVDYVLTRIEDPDGRYVDHSQFRLRFSDLDLLSSWPLVLFPPLFFLPGAIRRALAERRERAL